MNKIMLLVEGPTEEQFVKRILSPRWPGCCLVPIIFYTKRTDDAVYKGGRVGYFHFRKQICNLLMDSSAVLVTTMVDYEGMPHDFLGRTESKSIGNIYEKVKHVETAIGKDVGNKRFLPFVMLHEFEALLFSKPEVIAQALNDEELSQLLCAIRKEKPEYEKTPEAINDSPDTCPSARIEKLCAQRDLHYGKPTDGPIIAEKIGLETMLEQCPHFAEWIGKIDDFAKSNAPL
jgi:hypothetical protein